MANTPSTSGTNNTNTPTPGLQVLLPPWTNFPVPGFIRTEFTRRSKYGLKFPNSVNANTVYSKDYIGPQTSWVRLCSNSIVTYNSVKNANVSSNYVGKSVNGFVFSHGNVGFYERYGISNGSINANRMQTIGYERDGKPITLDNSLHNDEMFQKNRPPPVIESINVVIKSKIFRAATINWKCFSLQQLEFMNPFFFTPYSTVVLEWGWNNFSSHSLLDIEKDGKFASSYNAGSYELKTDGRGGLYETDGTPIGKTIYSAFSCPEVFEQGTKLSNGNYDGMLGKITSWKYDFNESDNSFSCVTEVSSDSKFQNAMLLNGLVNTYKNPDGVDDDSGKKSSVSFEEFFEKYFEPQVMAKSNSSSKQFKSLNRLGDLTDDDRLNVFDPWEYRGVQLVPFFGTRMIGDNKKKYVSLKLFIDAVNRFTAVIPNNNKMSFYSIRIDAYIGAHTNMISWDPDILIPNESAPFYYPESFLDDNINITSTTQPQFLKNKFDPKKEDLSAADTQMYKVLRCAYRQNLNAVINYKLSSNRSDWAFPENDKSPYRGKLKNIYVSMDFIKDVTKSATTGDMVDKICDRLNSLFPNVWKLERFLTQNCISIRDSNYLDKDLITEAKMQAGIDQSDSYLYYFEPFVQESVSKNFKFSVELKDSIASMVMNKSQHEKGQSLTNGSGSMNLQAGANPQIDNAMVKTDSYQVYDPINTEMIRVDNQPHEEIPLKIEEVEARKTAAAEKEKELRTGALKNVNESSIGFRMEPHSAVRAAVATVTQGLSLLASHQVKEALLTIPTDYKAKVLSLLEDPRGINDVNINNSPMPGTSVEFNVLGIGGFKLYQILAVRNLPEPYKDRVVFQIQEIKHQLQDNDWSTTIVCNVRSVKNINTVFAG